MTDLATAWPAILIFGLDVQPLLAGGVLLLGALLALVLSAERTASRK